MMFVLSCNNDGTTDTTRTDTTGNIRECRKEDFVTDVLDMIAKEIVWLNAGITKGTDNELKAEAKKMLADQENLRKQLRDYAQENNIILTDIDTTNIIDINVKPGLDWDEEWADEQFILYEDEKTPPTMRKENLLPSLSNGMLLLKHYQSLM